MTNDIGLVIWGCKGGCRTFCDNRVVNVDDVVIRQTLKDIRTFILFKQSGLDYYAVEFTPQHKVFTHYRSSNDSGSGAFIAFTIYVPHNKRIRNLRTILNEMMADYFREYMNPMSNTPLPGKYDDINRYTRILNEHITDVEPDTRQHKYRASRQDDTPQIIKFTDISAVDGYFDEPYRPEFFDCQEVMFLPAEYHDEAAKYNIDFVREPNIITKVSEPEPMSRLFCPDETKNGRLTRLKVNGQDMMAAVADNRVVAGPTDIIDATFEKSRYVPFDINGQSVSALITQGVIRKKGDDFEFGAIQFTPEVYRLRVVTDPSTKLPLDRFGMRLKFATGGEEKSVRQEPDGSFVFELKGPEVERTCQLLFLVSSDRASAMPVMDVRPADFVDQNKTLTVAADVFTARIEFKGMDDDSVDAVVTWPDPSGKERQAVVAYRSEQELALPVEGDRHCSVTLKRDDAKIELKDGVYVVTPDKVKVNLVIPKVVQKIFDKWAKKIELAGVKYSVKENGDVSLPFGWEYMGDLKLTIQKGEALKSVDLIVDGGRLCFNAIAVENRGRKPAQLLIGGKPYEIKEKTAHAFFKDTATTVTAANPDDKLTIEKAEASEHFCSYIVSDGRNTGGGNGNSDNPVRKPEEQKLPFGGNGRIYFIKCEKYQTLLKFDSDPEARIQPIGARERKAVVRTMNYTLYAPDGQTPVLQIDLNNPKHKYRSGDFKIVKTSHTEWEVIYAPTFTSRMIDFITSKLGLGLLSLLVIAGAGFGVWSLFLSGPAEHTLIMTFNSNDEIKGLKDVNIPGGSAIKATPSGRVLTLTSVGDTLHLSGAETVVIDYGNEGESEVLRISDLIPKVPYIFTNKTDSIGVEAGQSPATMKYNEIVAAEAFDSIAVAEYLGLYGDSKYRQNIEEFRANHEAAVADQKAKAAEIEKVKKEYNRLVTALGGMNATKATLDAVVNYQNEHNDVLVAEIKANAAKINAYTKFFDPAKSFDKFVKYFSPEQQKACKYYLTIKGNDPTRGFKYAKDKAAEMGISLE